VIPEALGVVWAFIRAAGIPDHDRNVVVYLDGEMNLECGVLIPRPFSADGDVIRSATPGGLVATAAHLGPYDRLGDAHQAVFDGCAAQGYRRAGPSWELYGHWTDDPSKLRTDVFWLLDEGTSDQARP
jgi:effector-binding domain-containing protein